MKLENKTYSLQEAATRCFVNRSTVYRWVKNGKLKARANKNGCLRINALDIISFLEDNGIENEITQIEQSIILPNEDRTIVFSNFNNLSTVLLSKHVNKNMSNITALNAKNMTEACYLLGCIKPDLFIIDIHNNKELCTFIEMQNIEAFLRISVIIIADIDFTKEIEDSNLSEKQNIKIFKKPITDKKLIDEIANFLKLM